MEGGAVGTWDVGACVGWGGVIIIIYWWVDCTDVGWGRERGEREGDEMRRENNLNFLFN